MKTNEKFKRFITDNCDYFLDMKLYESLRDSIQVLDLVKELLLQGYALNLEHIRLVAKQDERFRKILNWLEEEF